MKIRSGVVLAVLFFSISDSAVAQQPILTRIHSRPALGAAFNPASTGRTIFVSLGDTIRRSYDGGLTWHSAKCLPKNKYDNIHQILFLPTDTNVVFAVGETVVLRSSNGGSDWISVIDTGSADGETLVYHAESKSLYFAQSLGGPLYKSTNDGIDWTRQTVNNSKIPLCTIAVSPASIRTIFVGAGNGAIARSSDEGLHWDTTFAPKATQSFAEIPSIIYSLYNPDVAYATIYNFHQKSLIMSTDDGKSWVLIPADSSTPWSLEVDQRLSKIDNGIPMHLWIGLENSSLAAPNYYIFQESEDGGSSWQKMMIDSASILYALKFDTTSNTLLLATNRSVYKISYTDAVTSTDTDTLDFTITNNPMADHTLVRWSSLFQFKEIKLTDILGHSRYYYPRTEEHQIDISHSDLNSGVWMVQATSRNGAVVARKLLIE